MTSCISSSFGRLVSALYRNDYLASFYTAGVTFKNRFFSYSAIAPLTMDADNYKKLIQCITGIIEPILLLNVKSKHPVFGFFETAGKGLSGFLFLHDIHQYTSGEFTGRLFKTVTIRKDGIEITRKELNLGKVFSTISGPFFHLGHFFEFLQYLQSIGLADFSKIATKMGKYPLLAPLKQMGLGGLKNRFVVAGAVFGMLGVIEYFGRRYGIFKGCLEKMSEKLENMKWVEKGYFTGKDQVKKGNSYETSNYFDRNWSRDGSIFKEENREKRLDENGDQIMNFSNASTKAIVVFAQVIREMGELSKRFKAFVDICGVILGLTNVAKILSRDTKAAEKVSEARKKTELEAMQLAERKKCIIVDLKRDNRSILAAVELV